MLKRLALGLVEGVLIGAILAALFIKGLGIVAFSGVLAAYGSAVLTGAIAGLIAGRPIWARGAAVEAGLKAFFGAALGAAAMFALRRWLHTSVDLASLHAGAGRIADLPALSLPIVATGLSLLFELDNTGEPAHDEHEPKSEAADNKRVKSEAAGEDEVELDVAEADARKARRKG
jgi:hypothetical protein